MTTAIELARRAVLRVRPDADPAGLTDDTPLLESRVLSSFDLVSLILEIEALSGQRIRRDQLAPGSFRDLNRIAAVFFEEGLSCNR
jgi:acyl carrier protein